MSDDEELKEGLKRSMSEPAKRKPSSSEIASDEKEKEKYRLGVRNLSPRDQNKVKEVENAISEWDSKFDRNRG